MTSAQPQTVANQLISRLNALRTSRISDRSQPLAQVEFTARGLERSDVAGYYSVSSMIAALRGDRGRVRECERVLSTRFPAAVHERTNALRSLSSLAMAEESTALATDLAPHIDYPHEYSGLMSCLINQGLSETCLRLAEDYSTRTGIPASAFRAYHQAELAKGAGIDEARLVRFHALAFAFAEKTGWIAAPIESKAPEESHGDDDCIAILRLLIGSEQDEVEALEDQFLAELAEAREELFCKGIVVCSVQGWDADDRSD